MIALPIRLVASGLVAAALALVGGAVNAESTTPTATVVTVVNPQGSGNATATATSVYGQPVAVTFAVTAGSGVAAPDGSVSVYVDGFPSCTGTLGAPAGLTSTGNCNLTVPIATGAHTVSTSYTGTATFGSSSSSGPTNGSLTINKAATTTTITAHVPNPSVVNSPITVTVVAAAVPPGAGTPEGPFSVTDGSVTCPISPPATSCNLTPTTAGVKTLTARFPGDGAAFEGSTSPGVTHTVTGGGTTPTATVVTVVNPQGSGNATATATSVYGQPVAVTFTVTAGSGVAAPDGSVSVYVDGFPSCTGTLGAPAGLTSTGNCNLTVPIATGAHTVSTSYTGTATFGSSSSSGPTNGSLTINKAATTTTITAHVPNPSVVNSPITVTVVAAAVPPGAGTPEGPFSVTDGSVTCPISPPATSCNLTPTTAGVKTLTARFPGDGAAFEGSTSPGVTHTVTGGGTTPTATVVTVVNPQGSGNATATATSVYGQPVAVTFAVTAGSGVAAPDGSVSVYVDGFPSCTGTLGAPAGLTSTGNCNLTVPIATGAHTVSTSYTGTATFGSSSSSGPTNGSLTINKAATTTTITAHVPNPSVVNSPITVTVVAAAVPPGAGTPEGPFSVTDGSVTCPISPPATSCNLTPTTAGVKTLTARFPGDGAAFEGSTSPGVTHTVTGGTFTGPTVASGVDGTATVTGGGPTCGFVDPAFVAVEPLAPPPGTAFPFGLFKFTLNGCIPGSTATVQIVYTQSLPSGTQYWKYGPTPGSITPHWYTLPGATVVGSTVTFAINDGGIGDDDLIANGAIVDQGGPGTSSLAAPIPTLRGALLAVLALVMTALAWTSMRRRHGVIRIQESQGRNPSNPSSIT